MFFEGIVALRATLAGLMGTVLIASVGMADEVSIDNRSDFEAIVAGKQLRAVGVTLQVSPDGTVSGSAYGQKVTGFWTWDDGYFCRNLALGGRQTPQDCARVTVEDAKITFITDRGHGKSAWLRLR